MEHSLVLVTTVFVLICALVWLLGIIIYFLCRKPNIFSFKLNFIIIAILCFMNAGGFILFTKDAVKAPFLRTNGSDIPPDFAKSICVNESTSFNLPTAWFGKVDNEIFFGSFGSILANCLRVLAFEMGFLFVGLFWVMLERGQTRTLVDLLTSIVSPYRNRERNEESVIALMISSAMKNENYFLYSVVAEFACMLLGIGGLMWDYLTASEYFKLNGQPDYAAQLNGKEWIVDCHHQVTSEDVYALTECKNKDGRFESVCIAPIDTIYIQLSKAIWYCFFALTVTCVMILIFRIYEIWQFGLPRMNTILMLRLLSKNVDQKQQKEIMEAFASELNQKRRAQMYGTMSMKPADVTSKRDHPPTERTPLLTDVVKCKNFGSERPSPPADEDMTTSKKGLKPTSSAASPPIVSRQDPPPTESTTPLKVGHQCHNLSSKSPFPRADAAVTTLEKVTEPTSLPTSSPKVSEQVTTLANSTVPSHPNSQRPAVESAGSPSVHGGENVCPTGAVLSPQEEGIQRSPIGDVDRGLSFPERSLKKRRYSNDSFNTTTQHLSQPPPLYPTCQPCINHLSQNSNQSSMDKIKALWDVHTAPVTAASTQELWVSKPSLYSQPPIQYPIRYLRPNVSASNTDQPLVSTQHQFADLFERSIQQLNSSLAQQFSYTSETRPDDHSGAISFAEDALSNM